MKKFFTLVAMAFVAIGANAQAVIAEIDWTQQEAYYNDVWYPSDMANVSVSSEGLVIDCLQTSPETANYWEPQVPMIAHIEALEEGGQYQVKFDVNSPAAGEIRLDFCSWTEGAKTTQDWIGTVAAGDNEFTVDFLDYPGETTNAMIFYQCGKIPGKHVIKKVQVIDLEAEGGEETGPGILSEIDWTQESAYYSDVWYPSDMANVSVNSTDGLVIDCLQTSPETANYWEPQVPMIAHIPALEEGGQYQVKFDVTAPAAGEIRLDFCSWTEGAKTTQDWVGTVVEGYNEFTVDFLDYPGETTNAMIFYQCGKIPGKHSIKKVQVFDLEATGIQEVKAAKTVNTGLYNLAGQRVGLNYKGVVIQNGKKYLQK
ncbi:MAG: hypothetical protein IKN01_08505 [Prevotella sp.]|jgi:predicted metal-binding protein|nr:hypothetical protein [Prevotella sp.]